MKTMPVPRFCTSQIILLVSLFSLVVNSASAGFVDVYAFGDSLSDAGNAYALSGGVLYAPPYDQRASNGPVAVERLAGDLGISTFTRSTAGGTDYAVGGATTSVINSFILDGITAVANTGILSQVSGFVSAPPGFDPSSSLFFVWGGPNDIFYAAETGQDVGAAAAQAIVNLATEISMLASIGAEHFLVPNLPDLGMTPRGLIADPTGLSLLSQAFDAGLASALAGLETVFAIDIREFDAFSFLHNVAANPAAFGFTDVTDVCFNRTTGIVCANPDQYLFWDDVHPTARGHAILGDAFYRALPEPGGLGLIVITLLAVFTPSTRHIDTEGALHKRRANASPRI